ncbi:MAG: TetR/AcrR family transcriptional regulator [Eubacterium sp.]|nr:TetR/AcrR family transcriptional regulator [Eubacterium sp.]
MPPKVKFLKEEIIEAAVNITREKGISAVTAREVGAALGVSSRPLFTYFKSVDELKIEVYNYAQRLYEEYVVEGLAQEIPFLGVGQQYIRFAKEETELYKYLFLSPPEGIKGSAMNALKHSQKLVQSSLMKIYNISAPTADKYFRDLWLVSYSLTTLIVTGECPYSDKEISDIFSEFSVSICKAYKEIPGLAEGNYNKDEVFRKLVSE